MIQDRGQGSTPSQPQVTSRGARPSSGLHAPSGPALLFLGQPRTDPICLPHPLGRGIHGVASCVLQVFWDVLGSLPGASYNSLEVH